MDEDTPDTRRDDRINWMIAAQSENATAYESELVSLVPILLGFVRRQGRDRVRCADRAEPFDGDAYEAGLEAAPSSEPQIAPGQIEPRLLRALALEPLISSTRSGAKPSCTTMPKSPMTLQDTESSSRPASRMAPVTVTTFPATTEPPLGE